MKLTIASQDHVKIAVSVSTLYTVGNMFKHHRPIYTASKTALVALIASLTFLALPGALSATSGAQFPVSEQVIGKKPFSMTKFVVNARPEACYRVCTDYPNATKTFPTIKKCKVVEDKGNIKVINYISRPTGAFTDYEYILQVKETPNAMIEWRRISGDFKTIEGYWKFEAVNGGQQTQVTYATYVDGGVFMPQMLIKRQFKIDLPGVMTAFKTKAETLNVKLAGKANEAVD